MLTTEKNEQFSLLQLKSVFIGGFFHQVCLEFVRDSSAL